MAESAGQSDRASTDCGICSGLRHRLLQTDNWIVALNLNQDRLGKCMIALRRHETDALALTPVELDELWNVARATRDAISAAFSPDHYNFMFLMNQDAHVHLHVIPRYSRTVTFAGESWPVLTSLDGERRSLPSTVLHEIGRAVGSHLSSRLD